MITEIHYQYANEVLVYRVTPEPYEKKFTYGVKWIEYHAEREMFEIMLHNGHMRYLNPDFVIEYTVE